MNDPVLQPNPNRPELLRWGAVLALLMSVLGLASLTSGTWEVTEAAEPPAGGKEPTLGGIPLFANWPKQAPEAAIVLSGQTFGYLQPCGCSRPQFGGIERRATFIKSLKDKGWPVAAVDLGDAIPSTGLSDQAVLKYRTLMHGLREMGYLAIGLGKADFAAPGGIDRLLGEYALQEMKRPIILAANLRGIVDGQQVPLEARFKPQGLPRTLVDAAEVATIGKLPVAVVGVVGKSLWEEARKLDSSIDFATNTAEVLKQTLTTLGTHPLKPQLYVLLYQGEAADAAKLAADFPQFHIILCQASDPEPPQFPTVANNGKTLIVEVGHKGRFVGVVGVFLNPMGGFDLKYQLVPLGEEYITPGSTAAAAKINPTLNLLQAYAETVKSRNFLEEIKQVPHPNQIREPKLNLSYIGSARCQSCHPAESAKWSESKHAHAMQALEKIADRPTLRHLDPECVVCHTVGFGYNTGYRNATKTPQLAHVGCESCHGPGSGHAADPRSPNLLAMQSPWRVNPEDKLPPIAVMKKLAEVNLIDRNAEEQKLPRNQLAAINAVSAMCMKCHDMENDPHFNIYKYWPKIYHPRPKP
jgi:hypothetical protein